MNVFNDNERYSVPQWDAVTKVFKSPDSVVETGYPGTNGLVKATTYEMATVNENLSAHLDGGFDEGFDLPTHGGLKLELANGSVIEVTTSQWCQVRYWGPKP